MHYVTLLVNLIRFQRKTVRPVFQDQQTGVNGCGALGGNVTDTVDGLVNTRIGIQVTAELHTQGTGEFDNTIALEMLRAVESHVLQEVGKSTL